MAGTADGMAIVAHATRDGNGTQVLQVSYSDASTGGQLWTYAVDGATLAPVLSSRVVASEAFAATGTDWFQQVVLRTTVVV